MRVVNTGIPFPGLGRPIGFYTCIPATQEHTTPACLFASTSKPPTTSPSTTARIRESSTLQTTVRAEQANLLKFYRVRDHHSGRVEGLGFPYLTRAHRKQSIWLGNIHRARPRVVETHASHSRSLQSNQCPHLALDGGTPSSCMRLPTALSESSRPTCSRTLHSPSPASARTQAPHPISRRHQGSCSASNISRFWGPTNTQQFGPSTRWSCIQMSIWRQACFSPPVASSAIRCPPGPELD